jgi:sialate O-acetylesterase
MPHRLASFLLLFLVAVSARAEVKLHGLFTDNLVLQQGIKIPVWGTAADGEKVVVTLGDAKAEATAAGARAHRGWREHDYA